MIRSRTALAQMADALTGASVQHSASTAHGTSPQNPIEMALLGLFFTAFAWLAAFEMLDLACSSHVAAWLAVPGAFVLIHAVPAGVGLVLGLVATVIPAVKDSSTSWWSEEIHLLLATIYAGFSRLEWAKPLFRIWLAVAALNLISFIILRTARTVNSVRRTDA